MLNTTQLADLLDDQLYFDWRYKWSFLLTKEEIDFIAEIVTFAGQKEPSIERDCRDQHNNNIFQATDELYAIANNIRIESILTALYNGQPTDKFTKPTESTSDSAYYHFQIHREIPDYTKSEKTDYEIYGHSCGDKLNSEPA